MPPRKLMKRNSRTNVQIHAAWNAQLGCLTPHIGSTSVDSAPTGSGDAVSGSVLLGLENESLADVSDVQEDSLHEADMSFDSDTTFGPLVSPLHNEQLNKFALSTIRRALSDNTSGWNLEHICWLLLYTAKKTGVSDLTLGRFLRIIALLVNLPRSKEDIGGNFPSSLHKLKELLKIDPAQCQKIVYICPGTTTVRRKNATAEKEYERCGFRLTPGQQTRTFICKACEREWDQTLLDKDGNHFVTTPVHTILTRMMTQMGRYTSSEEPPPSENGIVTINDVTDGTRFMDMNVTRKDLVILAHSDGAEFSKSTPKKLWLTYIQCLNVPLQIRLPVWALYQVWVGDDLPKDRECFLMNMTQQLKEVQAGNSNYTPVKWVDKQGIPVESSVYVHSYLADTPELTALNGQLSHSAAQGCVYCLQVAVRIEGRMCYRYRPDVGLKTHDLVKAMAEQYESSSTVERTSQLKKHETNGFKRPSVVLNWEKFDTIKGFCIDVMHMFDERVSRYLAEQLMEKESVLYRDVTTSVQRLGLQKMNQRWLDIRVTGNNNRELRSLYTYAKWKAHELRFFIQHGLVYITKNLVPQEFYKVFCLASRIAYSCTRDSISPEDVESLRTLCGKFMVAFESTFGVGEMKYSIHLFSHIWLGVKLYEPLHIVSCYGPEDQIGRISRKILAMKKTTKNVLNTANILTECTLNLEAVRLSSEQVDHRVLGEIRAALGLRSGQFVKTGRHGTCRVIGRGRRVQDFDLFERLCVCFPEEPLDICRMMVFQRAHVESGINVRSDSKSSTTRRNESIVMDNTGDAMAIDSVIVLVDERYQSIIGTYVYGVKMEQEGATEFVGTRSVRVPHVFLLKRTETFCARLTSTIVKQFVILQQIDDGHLLVSPPSNRFRPT